MPCGLGQLTNLPTLSRFVVDFGSVFRHSCGLNELHGLNNLRGELLIWGLSHKKHITSKFKAANLKEKQYLCTLDLNWCTGEDFDDFDGAETEMSLEGFQPYPNLRMLYLSYYKGSRLPGWLLSLTNLVRLELGSCKKCQYLLQLSQLPSLKRLRLNDIGAMQYISDYDDRNDFTSSSVVPASFFPSLKELHLVNCPNLRVWWRWDSSVDVDNGGDKSPKITIVTFLTKHHSIPSFPCLSELFIKDCPMLTSMPIFSRLEKELYLFNASLKPLQQTMLTAFHLSNLKHLQLSLVMELENLSEWLQNLISLSSLTIEHCHKLKSFLPGIQHLTTLKDLKLCHCPNLHLAEDEDGMQWQELKSLLSLEFQYLPRLASLPTGLQHVVALQRLKILNCEKMTAIPGWIQKLITLEVLELVGCSGLTALPEGMRQLSSLHKLKIADNPCIWHRCRGRRVRIGPRLLTFQKNIWICLKEKIQTHASSADSESDAEAVESVEKERKGIIPRLFKNARSRS